MAVIKQVEHYSGTLAIADVSEVVNLTTSVDMSKTILFFNADLDSAGTASAHITAKLTSSSQVTITRSASVVAINYSFSVVEYTSGVTVQRGTFAPGTAWSTGTTLMATVDTSKAFVIVNSRQSSRFPPREWMTRCRISSAIELTFNKSVTIGGVTVEWQVVEYDGANIYTNYSEVNGLSVGTSTSTNVTLPTPVDLTKTIVIYSFQTSDASVTSSSGYQAKFTDSSTLNFSRTGSTSLTNRISYAVIEFTDGTTVQSGENTHAAVDTQDLIDITPVSLDKSIVYVTGHDRYGAKFFGTTDASIIGHKFLDTDTIQFDRLNSTGIATYTWFVVEFNDILRVIVNDSVSLVELKTMAVELIMSLLEVVSALETKIIQQNVDDYVINFYENGIGLILRECVLVKEAINKSMAFDKITYEVVTTSEQLFKTIIKMIDDNILTNEYIDPIFWEKTIKLLRASVEEVK